MSEQTQPIEQKEISEEVAKKRKANNTWKKLLAEDIRFITNVVKDPLSLERAKSISYTKASIEKMIALGGEVMKAEKVCTEKYADKKQQFAIFKQGLKNLEKEYMRHVKMARKVFNQKEQPGIYDKLQLKGDRPNPLSEKIDYITKFYGFALEDKEINDAFKKLSINDELMQQLLNLADEVVENNQLANLKLTHATRATEAREALKDEFYAWFKEFKVIYELTPEPKPAPASSTAKSAKATT
ncbi:hypothetical protein R9C00_11920 [Flammeovirgaceae bacterium SG7u.111]|nr:hypothetical protein [Flammeovirgaceae bacterium SG7u.132]WPO38160.1 hypothetical protein R9C00_11920 [Flammeovirgaceae bacterium SG7u.111]